MLISSNDLVILTMFHYGQLAVYNVQLFVRLCLCHTYFSYEEFASGHQICNLDMDHSMLCWQSLNSSQEFFNCQPYKEMTCKMESMFHTFFLHSTLFINLDTFNSFSNLTNIIISTNLYSFLQNLVDHIFAILNCF